MNNSKSKDNLSDFLIAIRAYNEGKTLYPLIKEIAELGYKNIALIDDNSKDNTKEIAEKLKNELKNCNFYYIKHLKNLGPGGSLLTALKLAKKLNKHLIILDGDFQHKPKDISNFLEIRDYDIIFGNRYLIKNKLPIHRKIFHYLSFLFEYFFSFYKVNDIPNGFKAFNKKTLYIFEKELIYFDYSEQYNIFFIASKYKLKYKEVPVEIEYNEETLKKGQKVYKTFIKILIKSILLRFFTPKKLFIFSFLLTLFLLFIPSFILFFSVQIISPFLFLISLLIIFLINLAFIYSTLIIYYKKTKLEKEFKDFISEESIRLSLKQKENL